MLRTGLPPLDIGIRPAQLFRQRGNIELRYVAVVTTVNFAGDVVRVQQQVHRAGDVGRVDFLAAALTMNGLAAHNAGGDLRVGFENSTTDANGTLWPDVQSSIRALTERMEQAA